MNIEPDVDYPAKLLVAVSAFSHCATVVDLDGEAAQFEVQSVSSDCDQMGIDPPREHGLWVWSGIIRYGCRYDNSYDRDPYFGGTWRRATADEALKFGSGIALWWKPEQ